MKKIFVKKKLCKWTFKLSDNSFGVTICSTHVKLGLTFKIKKIPITLRLVA